MITENGASQGPGRRHGDRRQQPTATLPFSDRRADNRRSGADRRSNDRD